MLFIIHLFNPGQPGFGGAPTGQPFQPVHSVGGVGVGLHQQMNQSQPQQAIPQQHGALMSHQQQQMGANSGASSKSKPCHIFIRHLSCDFFSDVVPAINPQTGQPDYSAQWAEYYRTMGMHEQAALIEQQMKQTSVPQQQPGRVYMQ